MFVSDFGVFSIGGGGGRKGEGLQATFKPLT